MPRVVSHLHTLSIQPCTISHQDPIQTIVRCASVSHSGAACSVKRKFLSRKHGTLLDPQRAQTGMIILTSSKAAECKGKCTMDTLLACMHQKSHCTLEECVWYLAALPSC